MASIYKPSESGVFYAQVLNGDGSPANAATVTLTVWKDDGSKFLNAVTMSYIAASNGMYKYAFTAPATVERMVADVSSINPTAYGTEDIYVGQWTDDIGTIKAKTDLIPADIATQIDTNIPAIKAKTDNLPSDPADESLLEAGLSAIYNSVALGALETTAQDIKAKTDNLPSDPADESLLEAAIASAGTAPQVIRDAMKLAPSVGAPAAGSVDKHLDDIETEVDELESKESFKI